MKVIFLDIDGVLNAGNYADMLIKQGLPWEDENGALFNPACVECLRQVIEQTRAQIVISSSWKRGLGGEVLYKDMLKIWKDRNLPGEMIDCTPNLSSDDICQNQGSLWQWKGYEIQAWIDEYEKLSNNILEGYVIVDDEEVVLPHQQEHFVQTNYFVGISEQEAEKMTRILNKIKIIKQ